MTTTTNNNNDRSQSFGALPEAPNVPQAMGQFAAGLGSNSMKDLPGYAYYEGRTRDAAASLLATRAGVPNVGQALTFPIPHGRTYEFKQGGHEGVRRLINDEIIHAVPVVAGPFLHYALTLSGAVGSANSNSNNNVPEPVNYRLEPRAGLDDTHLVIRVVNNDIGHDAEKQLGTLRIVDGLAQFTTDNPDKAHLNFAWTPEHNNNAGGDTDSIYGSAGWLKAVAAFALDWQIVPNARW